MVSINISLR